MAFIFPYIGNNHPNWIIFFRGVETTNQWYFRSFKESCETCLNSTKPVWQGQFLPWRIIPGIVVVKVTLVWVEVTWLKIAHLEIDELSLLNPRNTDKHPDGPPSSLIFFTAYSIYIYIYMWNYYNYPWLKSLRIFIFQNSLFPIRSDRGFPKADRLWLCQDLGPLHADAPQLIGLTQGPDFLCTEESGVELCSSHWYFFIFSFVVYISVLFITSYIYICIYYIVYMNYLLYIDTSIKNDIHLHGLLAYSFCFFPGCQQIKCLILMWLIFWFVHQN